MKTHILSHPELGQLPVSKAHADKVMGMRNNGGWEVWVEDDQESQEADDKNAGGGSENTGSIEEQGQDSTGD